MEFKVKSFKIGAGKPIVFVHKEDAKKLNIHIGNRVELSKGNKSIIAVVDLVGSYFKIGQIGASEQIIKKLGLKSKDLVNLNLITLPRSTKLIQKKLSCSPYKKEEINSIVKDIVSNALTEAEIAYFVSGVYHCGMSNKEIIDLTDAIYKNGLNLSWHYKKIADKHSIGGVPGNRTTPVVVSICAAAGIVIPKTSSKAITSAAGTADVIGSIAEIDFSISKLKQIVKKTNACLAWGGSLGLAPADDKLIQVEKLLNLDPEPQLIASIMAKKLAAGSKYVLIDIPYGAGAKVTKLQAIKLKNKFLKIGKHFKLNIKVILTDGSQPIGNGIGPILEVKDILRVLTRNNPPKDLEDKSVKLAGVLLEMIGKAKPKQGQKKAKEILDSGNAYKKFEQIIKAQNGDIKNLKQAKLIHKIKSSRSGKIKSLDNKKISSLARIAGSPSDKSSGLYIHKHKLDSVKKGEIILEIHSESKQKMSHALKFFKSSRPIMIK